VLVVACPRLCVFPPIVFELRCRAVIGENFEFQDDICGVVAQPRQQKDKVAIWLTRCDSEPRLRGIGTPACSLFAHCCSATDVLSGEQLKHVLELPDASVSFEHFKTPPPGSATAMLKTL
jgi:hypothetical protein